MKLPVIPAALLSAALLAGCAQLPRPATPAPATARTPAGRFPEVTIDGVAGFQDTPLQPDGKWHVHDPARPQPPVVTPGSFSEQAAPPSDAIILFDGKDLSQWRDKATGGPAAWTVADGVAVSAKGDIQTTNQFGDLQLHVEFREPTPPNGEGQGRGNSGVFLMGKYEIQVLDGYHNKTYADGAAAGIYGQHPPLANACRPPGEWQTYDILFNVPHFGDGAKPPGHSRRDRLAGARPILPARPHRSHRPAVPQQSGGLPQPLGAPGAGEQRTLNPVLTPTLP